MRACSSHQQTKQQQAPSYWRGVLWFLWKQLLSHANRMVLWILRFIFTQLQTTTKRCDAVCRVVRMIVCMWCCCFVHSMQYNILGEVDRGIGTTTRTRTRAMMMMITSIVTLPYTHSACIGTATNKQTRSTRLKCVISE